MRVPADGELKLSTRELNGKRLKKLKNKVAKAYGLSCIYCESPLCSNTLTIDHVKPRKRGGHNAIWNVVPACEDCNLKKKTLTINQFCTPEQVTRIQTQLTRMKARYYRDHLR